MQNSKIALSATASLLLAGILSGCSTSAGDNSLACESFGQTTNLIIMQEVDEAQAADLLRAGALLAEAEMKTAIERYAEYVAIPKEERGPTGDEVLAAFTTISQTCEALGIDTFTGEKN